MKKKTRRDLHAAINALTHEQVAQIIKRQYPRAKGERIDELAKKMIGEAHRIISPRNQRSAL
jgi:hypothetical protein